MNNKVNYIMAVLFDNIGSSFTAFILPLFILDLTGSSIHLSMIAMINSLPYLLLGLPFGALIDRMNLKKVLNYSDAIRAISYFILSVIFFSSLATDVIIMAIYLVTIITASVNVLNSIAETTFIPEIVQEHEYSHMNSIIFGLQYIAGLIVPFIGGYIYSVSIVPYVFLGNAFTFIISAIFIYHIQYSYKKTKEPVVINEKLSSIRKDLKEGICYVMKQKELSITLVIVALYNIVTANFKNDMLILFKIEEGFTSTQIGIMLMVTSLGALIGSVICTKLSNKFQFKQLLLMNLSLHVFFRFLFTLFNIQVIYMISICMIFLLSSVLNIIIISNRQKLVERAYLGRANSMYKTVLVGSSSVGFLYGGTLTNSVDTRTSIMISTVLLFVLVIICSPVIQSKFHNES